MNKDRMKMIWSELTLSINEGSLLTSSHSNIGRESTGSETEQEGGKLKSRRIKSKDSFRKVGRIHLHYHYLHMSF